VLENQAYSQQRFPCLCSVKGATKGGAKGSEVPPLGKSDL